MEKFNDFLPDRVEWREKRLILRDKKGDRLLSSGFPILDSRKEIIDFKSGETQEIVEYHYILDDLGRASPKQISRIQDILSGEFIKERPGEVIIEPGCMRTARDVFITALQKQFKEAPVEKEIRYQPGWNGQHYHHLKEVDRGIVTEEKIYQATVRIAQIAKLEYKEASALLLASVQGTLRKIFLDAGIHHNYVTYIYGETSIGKTSLAKMFCDEGTGANIISMTSDRKRIRNYFNENNDITIVADDVCKTSSSRVYESQLQKVSEIIQESVDTGKLLLNESDNLRSERRIHVVMTAELELKNPSSINRCFYIKMENPLEESDWEFVKKISDEKYMHYFKIGFVDYLENNYEQVVQNVKTNYGLYLHELKEMKSQSGNSGKRIADTLALLMVTKKVLQDYFAFRNIDNGIILKIDNIIRRNIIEIGKEMNVMLDDMQKKESHTRYLPALAKVISEGWYKGYFIAEDEKSYCQNLNKCDEPRKYIGFYSNDGFLSFKPEDMCLLLEDIFEAKNVTMSELAKELRTYSLVHVNSENKNSCRWNTKGKYYHVHIRQLLELALTYEELKEYDERKAEFGW